GFILAMVLAGFVIYAFRKRGIWNKFILKDELKTELGYVSQPVKEYLLGKTGKALTPLRPAGTAVFDGERVDVVTAGEFIGQGQPVTVVLVEGGRVVVSGQEV
ncbi:MAG: serine protease, partial [Paenibacillaceae bacterium]|nr:serine protease [Paenibacillaceae bacterium]